MQKYQLLSNFLTLFSKYSAVIAQQHNNGTNQDTGNFSCLAYLAIKPCLHVFLNTHKGH